MLTTAISLYLASTLSLDQNYNSRNQQLPILARQEVSIQEITPIPVKNPEYIAPVINASAAIAIDMGSGRILYEKNMHERRQFASITKLMTAIVIMEENSMDEVVTISNGSADTGGSQMYLLNGEKIRIQNLVYGLLIKSANDAALALSEYNAGSEEKFVEKMNNKAKQLKLKNTHFSNPIGYDNPGNYSSAYDLGIIGKYAYQKKLVKHAVSLNTLEVKSEDGGITHELSSTNELLDSYIKFKGLKTGSTDLAGECFIGIAQHPDGHEILTVVLNSPDRFKESKILADWTFRAYQW